MGKVSMPESRKMRAIALGERMRRGYIVEVLTTR